jgi:hypothetical protein
MTLSICTVWEMSNATAQRVQLQSFTKWLTDPSRSKFSGTIARLHGRWATQFAKISFVESGRRMTSDPLGPKYGKRSSAGVLDSIELF